ncbi:MAG: NAD-dependent deacylase [Candidatus Schekmanbacteria bacterium]|nr:NAD-dependent deacylase [Candidatus Schekmanbacteria bacterium]
MALSAEHEHQLRQASHGSIVALTGAGISAESKVPTFRGADGLWRRYRAEDLATPYAFAADPLTVWEWYDWRRGIIAAALPNAGHHCLRRLELAVGDQFQLITQNVDGLHQRAGTERVLELHGNIWRTRCTGEHHRVELMEQLPELPPCCECGALLRPDIVWFGESLDPGLLDRAFAAATGAALFLVIGTSAVVTPAADLPRLALAQGAFIAEINPEPTILTPIVHLSLRATAGEALPELVDIILDACTQ